MTSPTLQVTPEGLLTAAQRCSALAATVAPALPTAAASGAWQSTGAATSTMNAGMSTTATASKTRMTANSGKLTRAAADYQHQDDGAAQRLHDVGSHILPPGAGGDGGAAGGRPPLPTLVRRSTTGVDGGAGGLGTGR